jgi:hypothetical protein
VLAGASGASNAAAGTITGQQVQQVLVTTLEPTPADLAGL